MLTRIIHTIGRLHLTDRDTVVAIAESDYDDHDVYSLNQPKDRKELLLKHGHDAADMVSWWRYESENDGAEQREAAAELWRDYHNSRGVA